MNYGESREIISAKFTFVNKSNGKEIETYYNKVSYDKWLPFTFDEKYLNFATVELSRRLATPFCTMEIAKRKNSIDWYFIDITNGCNFDMRPCELAGIYEPVRNLLIEQLIDWAQTPRPMLVNTSIQDIVTKRQLFRADLKGQDAKLLKEFAKEHGIRYTGKEFQSEKKEFIDKYHKLHD